MFHVGRLVLVSDGRGRGPPLYARLVRGLLDGRVLRLGAAGLCCVVLVANACSSGGSTESSTVLPMPLRDAVDTYVSALALGPDDETLAYATALALATVECAEQLEAQPRGAGVTPIWFRLQSAMYSLMHFKGVEARQPSDDGSFEVRLDLSPGPDGFDMRFTDWAVWKNVGGEWRTDWLCLGTVYETEISVEVLPGGS